MKILLRRFLSLFLFLCLTHVASQIVAQNNRGQQKMNQEARMKDFLDMKKKFLKEKTDMTDAEEAQFFPLYMELQRKKFDLQRSLHRQINSLKQTKSAITDEMYSTVSEAINNTGLKESQLENDYYRKFSRILSPEKLCKFQIAEISFNRDMLRKRGRPNEGPKHHK